MTVKEESEKVGLKLNIQKRKIMASGTITSWEIDGETVEIVSEFIFGGSKITADGDCSHEVKICCLLWRKAITNLNNVLKRHHFANKSPYSQSYVFSSSHVWIWKLDHKEGWALKNWSFWNMLLEKTPDSLLNARRSNQSIIQEIKAEYSLERLRLKL